MLCQNHCPCHATHLRKRSAGCFAALRALVVPNGPWEIGHQYAVPLVSIPLAVGLDAVGIAVPCIDPGNGVRGYRVEVAVEPVGAAVGNFVVAADIAVPPVAVCLAGLIARPAMCLLFREAARPLAVVEAEEERQPELVVMVVAVVASVDQKQFALRDHWGPAAERRDVALAVGVLARRGAQELA